MGISVAIVTNSCFWLSIFQSAVSPVIIQTVKTTCCVRLQNCPLQDSPKQNEREKKADRKFQSDGSNEFLIHLHLRFCAVFLINIVQHLSYEPA